MDLTSEAAQVVAEMRARVAFFVAAVSALEKLGHPLQMVRFATNSFEEWVDLAAPEVALEALKALDAATRRRGLGRQFSRP